MVEGFEVFISLCDYKLYSCLRLAQQGMSKTEGGGVRGERNLPVGHFHFF